MNRRALIIGSSPSSDYLPGVSRDMLSWKIFLQSPAGGGWYPTEIHELADPKKSEVMTESTWVGAADYGMIIFIGHGYVKNDALGIPVTFLCINENEDISEREINPRTPRYFQISDCCRKYSSIQESSEISKEASEVSSLSIGTARFEYDKAIERSEKGWVRFYAADINQGAADINSFSNILIQLSVKWSVSNSNILDTYHANKLIKSYFNQARPQQTPVHHAGRRMHFFPIAVGAKS